ncbi:MAG: HU family DNA-binding protein [Phycisphaerae bacterium]|jgi:DNA-binding protein HU-beta|nr:HU family DNA-binding protein [Phycisphaerae bacterium]
MNRNEMIEGIMRQAGLSKANVGRFYAGLVELVRKELVRNKEFVLPGLGALCVRKRKARIGRNPRTGESIQIPAKKVVRFRAYSSLGELLNGPAKGPAAEATQTVGEDSDTANLWPQSDAPQEQ